MFQVPEEMKISKLTSTVLEGYQRSGYAGEGTLIFVHVCVMKQEHYRCTCINPLSLACTADFDLLLLRPDSHSHGMILESSKRLCDYDIKDNVRNYNLRQMVNIHLRNSLLMVPFATIAIVSIPKFRRPCNVKTMVPA